MQLRILSFFFVEEIHSQPFTRVGRQLTFGIAKVFGGSLLLKQATWSGDQNDVLGAQIFINGNFQTQALSNTLFKKRKVTSFLFF